MTEVDARACFADELRRTHANGEPFVCEAPLSAISLVSPLAVGGLSHVHAAGFMLPTAGEEAHQSVLEAMISVVSEDAKLVECQLSGS